MIGLVDRIVAIAAALDAARVPWALGGALALAYATEEPRGTRHIDVNVFVAAEHAEHAERVFAALPAGVSHGAADIATMAESHAIDLAIAADRLEALLVDDSRVGRLRAI